jgi:hypothetical protein
MGWIVTSDLLAAETFGELRDWSVARWYFGERIGDYALVEDRC